MQGFFFGVSGDEIRPHYQFQVTFFPIWKKNSQSQLKIFFKSSIYCEIQCLLFKKAEAIRTTVVPITPLIRTTVVPISGVIGTTVVRIANATGIGYQHDGSIIFSDNLTYALNH